MLVNLLTSSLAVLNELPWARISVALLAFFFLERFASNALLYLSRPVSYNILCVFLI